MGESLIMAARIALLLALVAVASARDWHYEFRHPTVTPNPRASNPFRPSRTAPVQPPAVRGTKAVPNCGQSKSTKIVGGSEVTPHAYPWQVGLFIDDILLRWLHHLRGLDPDSCSLYGRCWICRGCDGCSQYP